MFKLQYSCAHFNARKVMLKIFQAGLQQYVNWELPDVQTEFTKDSRNRDQIANIQGIIEKERDSQKSINVCFIDYAIAFDCMDQNKVWNNFKEWNTRPASWKTCMQVKTAKTKHRTMDWFKIGKGVRQGYILSPCLFNLMQSTSCEVSGWIRHKLKSRLLGRNINNLRYTDDTTLMTESEEELKILLWRWKIRVKIRT